jgi:hypothetical protein
MIRIRDLVPHTRAGRGGGSHSLVWLAAVALVAGCPAPAAAMLRNDDALVGAPIAWSSGWLGGLGGSDLFRADVAILQDKIDDSHPTFAGINFQRPVGAPAGACGSGCEHGSAVASVAVGRGVRSCPGDVPTCSSSDADDRGIAPGVSSVLDASSYGAPPGMDVVAWALGIRTRTAGTGDWLDGAAHPAEVLNDSHGDAADADDDANEQTYDKAVSETGVTYVAACGNDGPTPTSVNTPGIAYNSICVGSAVSPTGTVSDAAISDFSSRGPTPAGRKKPDLVAVGDTQAAWQHWHGDRALWHRFTGTSLAAPQVSGAAALLAGSGVTDGSSRKALLINSARPGRRTASDPMGTQTSWQPDWGWGLLDVASALDERGGTATSSVSGDEPRLFWSDMAKGSRATLVWTRRVTGTWGAGAASQPAALTDLDLELIDPETGMEVDRSDSRIDNVEQVHGPAGQPEILKVVARGANEGLGAEPFAVAAAGSLREVTVPAPVVELSAEPRIAKPGDPVTFTATIINPSADLAARSVDLDLATTDDAGLVGTQTQSVGDLEARGRRTLTWSATPSGDNSLAVTVTGRSHAFGDSYSGPTARLVVPVDGTGPTTSASLQAIDASTARLRWSATDEGSGAESTEVAVSTDDGRTWRSNATSDLAGSSVVDRPAHAPTRARVRARDKAGNVGGWADAVLAATRPEALDVTAAPVQAPAPGVGRVSPLIASTRLSEAPLVVTSPPGRPPRRQVAAGMRLLRLVVGQKRVVVAGRISAAATGHVKLSLKTTRGPRRADLLVKSGRFGGLVRLPRGSRVLSVTARFAGTRSVRAGAVTRTFR